MTCVCECHDRKSDNQATPLPHPQTPSTSYTGVYATMKTNSNESFHVGHGVSSSLSALSMLGPLRTINDGSGPSNAPARKFPEDIIQLDGTFGPIMASNVQSLVSAPKDPEGIIQLDGTTGPTSASAVSDSLDPKKEENQNENAGEVEAVKVNDDSCVGKQSEAMSTDHKQQECEVKEMSKDKERDADKVDTNQTDKAANGFASRGMNEEVDGSDFKVSHKRFRTPTSTAEHVSRVLKKDFGNYVDIFDCGHSIVTIGVQIQ